MKKFFEDLPGWARFWRASLVMLLDKKLKRNPRVADRMKYIKDVHAGQQKIFKNPKNRKNMTPEQEQQMRLMGPMILMMEQGIKKNPALTMKDLEEMAQRPELQAPRIRTRPGPPMRGRRRF
ncbi:MAG TPA: hypothetical protein VFJ58_07145 [Armatimonadota bacterium]|nr:hypothetical protein [Armatimonadota bacterium]